MPTYKPTTILKQEFPRGEAHSFDAGAFDEALRSQGVTLVHYRAMACPFGLAHKDDTTRRFHEDHPDCSNGYLYKKCGEITGLFTGNSSNPSFTDLGSVDGSTVTVTFPRKYDGSEETIYVCQYDRFYLKEETVLWPHWEIIEHNLSGRDKTQWPAIKVEHLIDNRLVEYREGTEFEVRNGLIHWLAGERRPGIDPDAGDEQRGRPCTVWYLFRPYFYVQRLMHEGRFIQTEDEVTGERQVTRMPFQASLVREHVFENQQNNNDASSPTSAREMKGPRDGSFGPG